jgi:hypothetical protein
MKKHQINAVVTDTHVEFRNFPPDCGWFDPIDDLMFLPLSLGLAPDSLSPEYIDFKDGVETIRANTYMKEFYGVRWDITAWNGRDRKKLAHFIIQDIRDRFESEVEVVVTRVKINEIKNSCN